MRTIPSCTLISDTICMSTSASHVIASIHELDDITAMLAPSPPALLRQLDHPVLLCNRSLGPAEFFRVVNYAAAQHLADVPVALPDLTEVLAEVARTDGLGASTATVSSASRDGSSCNSWKK